MDKLFSLLLSYIIQVRQPILTESRKYRLNGWNLSLHDGKTGYEPCPRNQIHHGPWNLPQLLMGSQVQTEEPSITSIFLPVPPFPFYGQKLVLKSILPWAPGSSWSPRLSHSLLGRQTKVRGMNWSQTMLNLLPSVTVNNNTGNRPGLMSKDV